MVWSGASQARCLDDLAEVCTACGDDIGLERGPEVQCMSAKGITNMLMVLRCLGVAATQSEVRSVAAAGVSRSQGSAA